MSKSSPDQPVPPKAPRDPRAARLKAALKANIAKRKAQSKARDVPQKSGKDDTQDL